MRTPDQPGNAKKVRMDGANLSGSAELERPHISHNHQLKYYIGPGNNCGVVKSVMKQRYWW